MARMMRETALGLLQQLPPESMLLPVQTLGERFRVLVRKAEWASADARAAVLAWGDAFPLIDTSAAVMQTAADLAVDHRRHKCGGSLFP